MCEAQSSKHNVSRTTFRSDLINPYPIAKAIENRFTDNTYRHSTAQAVNVLENYYYIFEWQHVRLALMHSGENIYIYNFQVGNIIMVAFNNGTCFNQNLIGCQNNNDTSPTYTHHRSGMFHVNRKMSHNYLLFKVKRC